MADYLKRNWQYLCGAALIHVLFAGVFGLTMINMQRHELKPVLAIQATLVDASKLNQAPSRPKPTKPPVDTQAEEEAQRQKDEAAKRLKEQQEEQERQAQAKQQEEQQKQAEAKEQQVREQKEVERKRVEADAKAEAKAKADAKSKAEADTKAKAEADHKRVAEIERKQKEEADRRKNVEDAQSKSAREAELKRQLAEEEGREQAVSSGLLNQYVAMIVQHVERQWNRPATARAGLECKVRVTQTPTGTVLSAEVTECNGDAAVKQSIETAVRKASPLPLPPDQRLFERNLVFIFKPGE
jgi:colicin import membrane protein